MKLTANGVDITNWIDILNGFEPDDSDLGNPVDILKFWAGEVDGVAIPIVPKIGHVIALYEDDAVTVVFGGRVSEVQPTHTPAGPSWVVRCQSWGVRMLEMITGAIGTTPPTTAPTAGVGGAGVLTGQYDYVVTFLFPNGIESPASPVSNTVVLAAQQGNVTNIPIAPATCTGKNLYRTPANGGPGSERLVVTLAVDTAGVGDNVPDSALGQPVPLTSDREIVISIFRTAMQARAFGSGTGISDPIITANEPNWPGVQATAFISGLVFSTITVKAAVDLLLKSLPGRYLTIGADTIVTYGRPRIMAPAPVTTSPRSAPLMNGFVGKPYSEQLLMGEHRNMAKYTGVGGATATAYDEVSYGRIKRILEAAPVTNAGANPGVVRQLAYASLVPTKAVARFAVKGTGYKAGQLVDIVEEQLGSGTIPAPFPDVLSLIAVSDCQRLATGSRGRWQIQKVKRRQVAPTSAVSPSIAEFDIEAGAYIRDLPTGLAVLAGLGT